MTRSRSRLVQTRDQAWCALVAMCLSVGAAGGQSILALSADELRKTADRGLVIVGEPQSSLSRLATTVASASPEERVLFARLAITAMADAFDQEVRLARHDVPTDAERRREILRWSSATSRYTAGLYGILERLEQGAPVEVFLDAQGDVGVLVDQMPVIVAGPRIRDPESLEETIVTDYCRVYPCDLGPPPAKAAAPAFPSGSFTGWNLREGRRMTFETPEGIHFMFADMADRQRRQTACLSIVRELRGAAVALRHAVDLGYPVDWEFVRLHRELDSPWHRIAINRGGDYLHLELPAMAKAPAIWTSSLPWLRAQVEGQVYRQYLHRAEVLLAELLAP